MKIWMILLESLKNSGVLTDGISETVKHEIKYEGGSLGMLLGTLGDSMLEICELETLP